MTEISLRDYFAGKVVQGILANEFETLELFKSKKPKEDAIKDLAKIAYQIADALIEKRKEDSHPDLTQGGK